MARKRYIVELGTGADLHGEDVTKAACRAVNDAVSRSCLCGLIEILNRRQFEDLHVEVLVACPRPEAIDVEKVKAQIPISATSVKAVACGLQVRGICVDAFARNCDTIVMANAAVTVFVDVD